MLPIAAALDFPRRSHRQPGIRRSPDDHCAIRSRRFPKERGKRIHSNVMSCRADDELRITKCFLPQEEIFVDRAMGRAHKTNTRGETWARANCGSRNFSGASTSARANLARKATRSGERLTFMASSDDDWSHHASLGLLVASWLPDFFVHPRVRVHNLF